MSRVLVTGGCGFIGSHLVDELVRGGHEVVVLDSLTYCADVRNLPPGTDQIESRNALEAVSDLVAKALTRAPVVLVHGDVCDADLVRLLAAETEACVHLAAHSHVDRSFLQTDPFVMSNVVGTHRVLEAFRETKKRVVVFSTDEIYGHQHEGFVQENEKLDPRNPYSAMKAAADLMAQTWASVFGMNVCILRPSNTYGPRQYPEKFMPKVILSFLQKKKMPIHGDGNQVRDWLWVEDLARAAADVMEKGRPGRAYNVCPVDHKSVNAVTEMVGELLGVDWRQYVEYVPDRLTQDRRYAMDPSRIRGEIGWNPKVRFEDGLRRTVDWLSARRDQLRPVIV